MNLSDAIIQVLMRKGVRYLFFAGSPQDVAALPLAQAAVRFGLSALRLPGQADAYHAAQGYGLAAGSPAVLIVTNAQQLVTAIHSPLSSAPMLILSISDANNLAVSTVNECRVLNDCAGAGNNRNVSGSVPADGVKWNAIIENESSVRYELEKALFLASRHGRRGTAILDLSLLALESEMDLQTLSTFHQSEEYWRLLTSQPPIYDGELDRIIRRMRTSLRPVILAGGGVRHAGAAAELAQLAELTGFPVQATPGGLSSAPAGSRLRQYRRDKDVLPPPDLVLALGCSREECMAAARHENLIRVDFEGGTAEESGLGSIEINSDIRLFLTALSARLDAFKFPRRPDAHIPGKSVRHRKPLPLGGGSAVVRSSLPGLDVLLRSGSLPPQQGLIMLPGRPGSEFAAALGASCALPDREVTLVSDLPSLSRLHPELQTLLFPTCHGEIQASEMGVLLPGGKLLLRLPRPAPSAASML